MMDDDDLTIDDLDPAELELETINAYSIGNKRITVTVEVSDFDEDAVRSFFVEVDFSQALRFTAKSQIEDSFLGHVSIGPDLHYLLELGGIIHQLSGEERTTQNVPNVSFRSICVFGADEIIIVGEDGANYRLDGKKWRQIKGLEKAAFYSVHGGTDGTVAAAGHNGVVATLNEGAWARVQLPTNEDFNAVWSENASSLFLAGNEGLCLHIKNSEMITLNADPFDYFGICEFQGSRYWSSAQHGLSIQKENEIIPFKELSQAFTMTATEEYLVITGWKSVYLFDGKEWRGFAFGYDKGLFVSEIEM